MDADELSEAREAVKYELRRFVDERMRPMFAEFFADPEAQVGSVADVLIDTMIAEAIADDLREVTDEFYISQFMSGNVTRFSTARAQIAFDSWNRWPSAAPRIHP